MKGRLPKLTERARGVPAPTHNTPQLVWRAGPKAVPRAKTNPRQLEAKPGRAVPALGPKPKPKLNPAQRQANLSYNKPARAGLVAKNGKASYKGNASMTRQAKR